MGDTGQRNANEQCQASHTERKLSNASILPRKSDVMSPPSSAKPRELRHGPGVTDLLRPSSQAPGSVASQKQLLALLLQGAWRGARPHERFRDGSSMVQAVSDPAGGAISPSCPLLGASLPRRRYGWLGNF